MLELQDILAEGVTLLSNIKVDKITYVTVRKVERVNIAL